MFQKYRTAGKATDGYKTAHVFCLLDNQVYTDTHSEHVMPTAFLRQKWLRERASMLC